MTSLMGEPPITPSVGGVTSLNDWLGSGSPVLPAMGLIPGTGKTFLVWIKLSFVLLHAKVILGCRTEENLAMHSVIYVYENLSEI